MNVRHIVAVTAGVLLTMVGVSGTAMARDRSETYMGSYDSQSSCQRTGERNGNAAGEHWSGYRCEGRWEQGPQDDEYKYALYVKNFQPAPQTNQESFESVDIVGDLIKDAIKEGKIVVQELNFNDRT
jgi:hypothetical protein